MQKINENYEMANGLIDDRPLYVGKRITVPLLLLFMQLQTTRREAGSKPLNALCPAPAIACPIFLFCSKTLSSWLPCPEIRTVRSKFTANYLVL